MAEDSISPDSLDLNPAGFQSSTETRKAIVELVSKKDEKGNDKLIEVNYAPVGEFAILEGDILLGKVDEVDNSYNEWQAGAKGVAITGNKYRWKSEMTIPYVVQAALKDRVTKAIAHWEKHTPIRFVVRTNQEDYISFEDRGGCFSTVGRQKGGQVLSLGSGCTVGNAIHEIGHALGLWHEQSREDRDNFVTIKSENVKAGYEHNFNQRIVDGDDIGEYDYGSIMHYPPNAFSKNGEDTIITKDGNPIGQREGLSKGDIAAIKAIYPGLNWPE